MVGLDYHLVFIAKYGRVSTSNYFKLIVCHTNNTNYFGLDYHLVFIAKYGTGASNNFKSWLMNFAVKTRFTTFYQPRSGMVKGRCGLLLFSKKTFVELFCFGSKLVWVLVSHLSYLTFFSISLYLICCCCSVRRLLFDLLVIIDISHGFLQFQAAICYF